MNNGIFWKKVWKNNIKKNPLDYKIEKKFSKKTHHFFKNKKFLFKKNLFNIKSF